MATDLVNCRMPALAVQYETPSPNGLIPPIELILTIAPPEPRLIISGMHCFVIRNVPVKDTANCLFQSSRLALRTGPEGSRTNAALLIRTSTPPHKETAS